LRCGRNRRNRLRSQRRVNKPANSDKVDLQDEDDSGEEDDAIDQSAAQAKPPKTPVANPAPNPQGKVKLMDGERIVFTEETNPQNYLKLIASGDVDETMLDALEDYVKRQKKRLGITPAKKQTTSRSALPQVGI
jgi:hypothetical protein